LFGESEDSKALSLLEWEKKFKKVFSLSDFFIGKFERIAKANWIC